MTEFNELMKRILPGLKGIVHKNSYGISFLSQEDFLQEILVYLFNEFKKGALADKTDSYILQGCYFYLKNYIRRNRNKARVISLELLSKENEGSLGWEEVVLWSDDAKQDYLGRLNDKMLSETILNNGLSKREKDILIFLSKGFTMREIGSFLGVSHVRVVKIVGSIREKCQKYADPL